jgi:hypothetical protein
MCWGVDVSVFFLRMILQNLSKLALLSCQLPYNMHSHLIPSPSPEGEGSKFSRGELKSKPGIPIMLTLLSKLPLQLRSIVNVIMHYPSDRFERSDGQAIISQRWDLINCGIAMPSASIVNYSAEALLSRSLIAFPNPVSGTYSARMTSMGNLSKARRAEKKFLAASSRLPDRDKIYWKGL